MVSTPGNTSIQGTLALVPRGSLNGGFTVTSFKVYEDWGAIQTGGPQHCVLTIECFRLTPFSWGIYQHAFKAKCIVPNKYIDGNLVRNV